MPRNFLAPAACDGSRSSTVRRRSNSVLPTLDPCDSDPSLSALTGIWSIRLDDSAAKRISSVPMLRVRCAWRPPGLRRGLEERAGTGRPSSRAREARPRARPGPSSVPRSPTRLRRGPGSQGQVRLGHRGLQWGGRCLRLTGRGRRLLGSGLVTHLERVLPLCPGHVLTGPTSVGPPSGIRLDGR